MTVPLDAILRQAQGAGAEVVLAGREAPAAHGAAAAGWRRHDGRWGASHPPRGQHPLHLGIGEGRGNLAWRASIRGLLSVLLKPRIPKTDDG